MRIETRIRKLATKKVKVTITKRRRCQEGFTVIDPNGNTHFEPTRKGALTNLLVKLQCASVPQWKIVAGKAKMSDFVGTNS